MTYTNYLVKYVDQPSRYDMRKLKYSKKTNFGTLVNARWMAHFDLTISRNGLFYIVIAKGDKLVGEVMRTAQGKIYWYPSDDGKYAAAGKYTLNEDGTLGTKWR